MRKRVRRGNCCYCYETGVELLRFDDEISEALACKNCGDKLKVEIENMCKVEKEVYLYSSMTEIGQMFTLIFTELCRGEK